MCGHALDTGTNTNVNGTGLQRISDVNDGLQTTGALTVQALHCGCLGEASNECCSTEFSCTTTGGKNAANGDIVDLGGIDSTLVDNSLEDTSKEICCCSILETTLTTLGQSGAQSTCDDDVVGVLGRDIDGALLATEVGRDLGKTLLS